MAPHLSHRWWASCLATESGRSKQLGPGISRAQGCERLCGPPIPLKSFSRRGHFTMPPTRDPFQQPVLDNDDSYLGKLRASKPPPCKIPPHLAQQQEPWNRLNATQTATSMRRNAYFLDSEIPKDDLDFRLAALYNHHTGAFKDKSEVLIHPETVQDTHGSIKLQVPGEVLPLPSPPPITSRANIRHWINPKKDSIHSIQGSIVSPHTAATNGGYSRKNDGGFFST